MSNDKQIDTTCGIFVRVCVFVCRLLCEMKFPEISYEIMTNIHNVNNVKEYNPINAYAINGMLPWMRFNHFVNISRVKVIHTFLIINWTCNQITSENDCTIDAVLCTLLKNNHYKNMKLFEKTQRHHSKIHCTYNGSDSILTDWAIWTWTNTQKIKH